MKRVIHFIPDASVKDSYPHPVPAKHLVPEWYRKAEMYIPGIGRGGEPGSGLKKCVPFLDSLLTGYLFVTWEDIHVTKLPDGSVSISFGSDTPVFNVRGSDSGRTMPRPAGYRDEHFAWASPWGWKTPRGYSTLVTHPLNRFDLPFITTSGIVDSDVFFGSGNIPFFLKEGFEGVIPKGTPYAQVIPIKRASWLSSVTKSLTKGMSKLSAIIDKTSGVYRDTFWVRKDFD